ncbi:ribonuclease HII [Orrella marina]|uniref:Ribonuclease HII n=1 Tax=Orrella marina TaxID=2163011 RepID=A0A2R4XHI7_9BURK|nr:ribonuclease HII [Orrella marina]AWB33231.1 ribonuclease HII [Orrella marina]
MSELMFIAGVDEAGRGPLAGEVFAAAVVLDPERPIEGLKDSKKLSPKRREQLAEQIRNQSLAWSIASASVEEIDSLNILQATMLAMQRAVLQINVPLTLVQVDGNRAPDLDIACETIIKGDSSVQAIAAASILAKTSRDASVMRLHEAFPDYGFDQHKGYGTALHLQRLRELGPTLAHRTSFAPVRVLLERGRP